MVKPELENLVKIKQLKAEPPLRKEYDGMLKSAQRALTDAQNESIEKDSQFDLAVEAAHKLALATLRREGYRSENRITVFQTLVHTIGLNNADLQVFLKAHNERNLAAYQGRVDIGEKLLHDLIAATKRLSETVSKLTPPAAA
jgi:hypothetical protein